jgi:transposase InsO family protein
VGKLLLRRFQSPWPFPTNRAITGIKRELTTPYNPQQNGVAERKNRTIMEAVKTMIHDQHLPMCLWAEAPMVVVYVQNRLSHSALGFKTPEEMFTGKKP